MSAWRKIQMNFILSSRFSSFRCISFPQNWKMFGMEIGFPRNAYICCAIFAQHFFCELLRIVCAWNAMSFAQFAQKRFFAKFAQNRKYYTKRNFLSKLSKIVILSKELTTEDSTITYKKMINIWVCLYYSPLVTFSYKN